MDLLSKPDQSAAVNLIGIGLKERPVFFEALLPRLQELRVRTGRPHWILIDEAHHVLPSSRKAAGLAVPQEMVGMMLLTLEPDRVAPAILPSFDVVIAIGENPAATMRIFAEAVGEKPPRLGRTTANPGEAVAWFRGTGRDPVWFRTALPRAERRRHRRKYAEGELPPDLCFYFRGPEGKLHLRAQNLAMFLQMADGVDDETWLFHLKEGDISRWFRTVIKDPELAAEAEWMESIEITAEESRKRIRAEIEQRYILAA
jgi:hypothetical protein